MRPKDRVLAALEFKQTDRVPTDFAATPEFCAKFLEELHIAESRSVDTPLIAVVNPRIMEHLGCDCRMVAPEYIGPALTKGEDGSWTNLFGVARKPRKYEGGIYWEYDGTPLDRATQQQVDRHGFPDPDWFDYSTVAEQCERFSDYCIVAGYPGNVDFLNKAGTLYGVSEVLSGLLLGDEVLFRIFDRLSEFFLEYNRRIFEAADGGIDIAYYGDDYGSQSGPLISPQMFREILAPRWKPHVESAKAHGMKVMLHSCGSVSRLYPEFVAAGFDAHDVVQPGIPEMDLQEIKQTYHGKLAFHGAADIQKVMPELPAERIREEVRQVIETLGKGGGFILAPTNKMPPEMPVDKVLAVYREAGSMVE